MSEKKGSSRLKKLYPLAWIPKTKHPIFNSLWSFPWLFIAVILLLITTWDGSPLKPYPLIELLVWLFGALSLAPVLTVIVDKTLNPSSTVERLKENYKLDDTDQAVIYAQLRRVAILIAVILAIALGV